MICLLAGSSCHTYTLSSGKKFRQLFPARDKYQPGEVSTSAFVLYPFTAAHLARKVGYDQDKKIIESLSGKDLRSLAMDGKNYTIYFLNPTCPGSRAQLHQYDSMARQGQPIMIVSLSYNYAAMAQALRNTSFDQYPYYAMKTDHYTTIMLDRQRDFIIDACSSCYEQYKDDVIMWEGLIMKDGKISALK